MKTYKYICDGGCIKIGNKSFSIHITNDFGDGAHRVYVGTEKDLEQVMPKNAKFVGSVEGIFNIYEYDYGDEVLCELSGSYSIFKYSGLIYLVKR